MADRNGKACGCSEPRSVELPLRTGDLILHPSLVGLVPPQDGSGVSLRSSGIEKKVLFLMMVSRINIFGTFYVCGE